ncbi:MAG: hypothetical protein ACK4YU_14805, partial [Paracoccus sp. (in: a-proteobacteria)]
PKNRHFTTGGRKPGRVSSHLDSRLQIIKPNHGNWKWRYHCRTIIVDLTKKIPQTRKRAEANFSQVMAGLEDTLFGQFSLADAKRTGAFVRQPARE